MKNKEHYITLILKHLEGSLTPEDKFRLHLWIGRSKKNKRLFEQIKQNWLENSSDNIEPAFDTKRAFKKIYPQLIGDTVNFSAPAANRSANKEWLRMVAVLAGFLIVSSFIYLGLRKSTITYSTDKDQTSTIILPDQSEVTLYANSSVTYSDTWEEEEFRTVKLQGEAFFEVKKDSEKPFLVNTRELTVRVLGTSFNVKNYPGDEFIETTLVEGSVEINKITDRADKVILMPHQKAVFSRKTKNLKLDEVRTDNFIALKNESFIFQNKRVGEIIKVISKKFKVSIQVENNSINDCTITADFSGKPLGVTLDLLCKLIDASYSIEDKEVRLEGDGCKGNKEKLKMRTYAKNQYLK